MNAITTSTELTQNLSERYHDILQDLDSSYFDKHHENHPEGLSGLFLTSIPENYHGAKNKIMIIGRETKSWGWFDNDAKNYSDLKDFIHKSMKEHQHFLNKKLNDKNSKGRGFHNFTRTVAKKCGQDGIIYSNLFCFSWNEKIPSECSHFETIKKYSEQLLKAQIEILEPEIIIFANGLTKESVECRREFFPLELCVNGKDYSDQGIANKQLWEFDLYQKIHCFRIQHPSSFSKDSMKARKFLIEKLPAK
jgi:hypothetical protein